LEGVASGYLADLDPELDTAVKTVTYSRRSEALHPTRAATTTRTLWGSFSRGRKQEDIQLYVRIDWNMFASD